METVFPTGLPRVVRDADSPSTGQPGGVVLHRVLILAGCEFSLTDLIIGSHHRKGLHLDDFDSHDCHLFLQFGGLAIMLVGIFVNQSSI